MIHHERGPPWIKHRLCWRPSLRRPHRRIIAHAHLHPIKPIRVLIRCLLAMLHRERMSEARHPRVHETLRRRYRCPSVRIPPQPRRTEAVEVARKKAPTLRLLLIKRAQEQAVELTIVVHNGRERLRWCRRRPLANRRGCWWAVLELDGRAAGCAPARERGFRRRRDEAGVSSEDGEHVLVVLVLPSSIGKLGRGVLAVVVQRRARLSGQLLQYGLPKHSSVVSYSVCDIQHTKAATARLLRTAAFANNVHAWSSSCIAGAARGDFGPRVTTVPKTIWGRSQ